MISPETLGPERRRSAAGVLFLARAVYAFNWYDIGALPGFIEPRFSVGTVQFGIILGAFLIGAGAFQLPAGLAALRWGNRSVSIAALAVMGGFCLASGVAPNWEALAALRFGAGAGAAFFFAPALGLVTSYFPQGSRGPVIGPYNAGFSLGSAVGLLGGALVTVRYGWPVTLALGGGLLLVVVPLALAALPKEPPVPRDLTTRSLRTPIGPILRSRRLWALTLGGTGLWAAFYIAAQYFVQFAHDAHASWDLALAATLPTVMILTEIGSGPFGGWMGERSRDMRRPLALWGLAAAALLGLVPFLPLAELLPVFVGLGFSCGVTFSLLYLIPSYMPDLVGTRFSFAVALLNSVQIFLGSAFAVGFALLASTDGYTVAWLFAAGLGAAFLPALIWVGPVSGRSATASGGVDGNVAVSSPPGRRS